MSGMFVRYNGPNRSFTHKVGEVDYVVQQQTLYTDRQAPHATLVTIQLSGVLVGSSPAAIDAKAIQLAAAYRDGGDLYLYRPGGVATSFSLQSSITTGGVRVTQPPSIPTMAGAAFATHLPYTIVVEGEVPLGNAGASYQSYSESVQTSGGGPKYGFLEPLTGAPVRMRLREQTVFRATQSGSAVGIYARPSPPAPLWPAWLKEAPQISKTSPRVVGVKRALRDFGISWSYSFESSGPLIGGPTVQ